MRVVFPKNSDKKQPALWNIKVQAAFWLSDGLLWLPESTASTKLKKQLEIQFPKCRLLF